ncbi:MAG TPA: ABC transporter substrate-binding protein [Candidatus Binatia bacterium]|jgi:NitT/TauT family transport system substrate-binding protein|nr:ABC transporter substrate-binding protein [Candidatus Binatia bacterium]
MVSVSILAILLLCAPGSSRSAEPTTNLKVGYLSIAAGHSVLWVTKEAGLFEKNGLSVETIYAPSSALTQAMLARSIPLGISGPVSPLEANLKGADFVVLGTLRKTPTLVYLVSHKKITSVQQLRGKKLGVGRFGSATDKVLVMTLKKVGIEPHEVSLLQLGNSALRMLALQQQGIDATILTVEDGLAAKRLGLNVLLDIRQLGIEYPTNEIITTRRFVEQNDRIVRAFMKSIVEGIYFYKTQKAKSIEIMKKYIRVGEPDVIEVGYDFTAKETQRKPYVSLTGMKVAIDDLATTNPAAVKLKPEQFVDSRFVTELDQNGFIDALYR